jgi:hypothetical protein
MARILVRTMRSDAAVQQRLREDYDCPPALRTIRQIRIEVGLEGLPPIKEGPFKAHEGYWPDEVSKTLRGRNAAFVRSLRAAYPERFAS